MSQRRLHAVRRRVAARRRIKTVAARQEGELQQFPAESSLDEDVVDSGLGEEVGHDPQRQRSDVPEQAAEAVVTEAPSLRPKR
jgi:hypothetical protein